MSHMSEQEKEQAPIQETEPETDLPQTEAGQEAPAPEAAAETGEAPADDALAAAQKALAAKEDQFLRLAAEYDNFRRRSQKEKADAYDNAKADAATAVLPVYDNLQRALAAPCADEAYVKGVEMTMNQLKGVLEKLGITEIPALHQPFDPNLHNAVMHVEDETVGESTVVEVFQSGFRLGEKVIRFAMVKVAN